LGAAVWRQRERNGQGKEKGELAQHKLLKKGRKKAQILPQRVQLVW
jgi:hypothetical protein